jgi:hypothetical protein
MVMFLLVERYQGFSPLVSKKRFNKFTRSASTTGHLQSSTLKYPLRHRIRWLSARPGILIYSLHALLGWRKDEETNEAKQASFASMHVCLV